MSGLEAVPPFTIDGDFVRDSTGSRVITCGYGVPACALYNARKIDTEPYHFMCPKCGRLDQRMIEATPEQCGLQRPLMGRVEKPTGDIPLPPGSSVVTGTESRVCADIAARQAKGVAKYGTTVEASHLTLREWLQHAYEECLDQAVYLKRAIEEVDK